MTLLNLIRLLEVAARKHPEAEVRFELVTQGASPRWTDEQESGDTWAAQDVSLGDMRISTTDCELRLVPPLQLSNFLQVKDDPNMP